MAIFANYTRIQQYSYCQCNYRALSESRSRLAPGRISLSIVFLNIIRLPNSYREHFFSHLFFIIMAQFTNTYHSTVKYYINILHNHYVIITVKTEGGNESLRKEEK